MATRKPTLSAAVACREGEKGAELFDGRRKCFRKRAPCAPGPRLDEQPWERDTNVCAGFRNNLRRPANGSAPFSPSRQATAAGIVGLRVSLAHLF